MKNDKDEDPKRTSPASEDKDRPVNKATMDAPQEEFIEDEARPTKDAESPEEVVASRSGER